ncbi:MAG: hypothetical protein D6704_08715 [Nitrospirae bacterium]|nr:MAG: hypothetical protein D6704_08715 [Nitrospirota bacterium]
MPTQYPLYISPFLIAVKRSVNNQVVNRLMIFSFLSCISLGGCAEFLCTCMRALREGIDR